MRPCATKWNKFVLVACDEFLASLDPVACVNIDLNIIHPLCVLPLPAVSAAIAIKHSFSPLPMP